MAPTAPAMPPMNAGAVEGESARNERADQGANGEDGDVHACVQRAESVNQLEALSGEEVEAGDREHRQACAEHTERNGGERKIAKSGAAPATALTLRETKQRSARPQ